MAVVGAEVAKKYASKGEGFEDPRHASCGTSAATLPIT
jgi:hypothetical protein